MPSPSRPMAHHRAPRKRPSVSRAWPSSPPVLSPPSPSFPPPRSISSSPSIQSSQDLFPPVPESNLREARLNQGISYAANVLARLDISPRSGEFLYHYNNEVSIAIKAKTHTGKIKSISVVRTLEVMIARNYFLRPTNSLEKQEAIVPWSSFESYNTFIDTATTSRFFPIRSGNAPRRISWKIGSIFLSDISGWKLRILSRKNNFR